MHRMMCPDPVKLSRIFAGNQVAAAAEPTPVELVSQQAFVVRTSRSNVSLIDSEA